MAQGGEQSQQKRRTRANTESGDPAPLLYPKADDKTSSSPNTDGFFEDAGEPPRRNTTVIRLENPQLTQSRTLGPQPPATPIPPRRQQGATTRNLPRPPRAPRQSAKGAEQRSIRKNTHWLLPVGLGMLAMLVLWVTGSWVLAWGIQRYNDITYGTPRTYQMDAIVGHGGDNNVRPSHFIAVNLNRQAIVIEFMAGDPGKSVSYVAPIYIAGDGGDLAPVTVEFRDVTGDNKPDMLVHIHLPSQDQVSVFINDGTKFRPSTGNDKYRI